MAAEVAARNKGEVVRPLRVIEGEIKELIDEAEAAAETARRPFYERIGPLLVEARDGHFEGNLSGFFDWAEKKFGKSRSSIRTYVAYGSSTSPKSFKNLE